MKKLLNNWDKKLRTDFSFWDLGLLKAYGMIPGLFLGAFFSEFIMKYFWLILAVFCVLAIRYSYLLFIKK